MIIQIAKAFLNLVVSVYTPVTSIKHVTISVKEIFSLIIIKQKY